MHYLEWRATNPALSVFHWDLLEQANANALKRFSKEEYLARGQIAVDMRETIMFWINQVGVCQPSLLSTLSVSGYYCSY